MEVISSTALVTGVIAVVVPVVTVIVNQLRLWFGAPADHLVFHADGREYIIDVAGIDQEDSAKIEQATKAVQHARELTA